MLRGPHTPSERVLLVDDDEDTLISLQDLLHVVGVPDVRRARSLADADHILSDGFCPTAVVLDLLLDGARGESFIGRLSRDPALARVPVIALSGDPRALAALDRSVARAFLKPADPEELVNELRRVSAAERTEAGAATTPEPGVPATSRGASGPGELMAAVARIIEPPDRPAPI